VTLGSLRARQDYMIAEGLLSPYVDGKALPAASDPMLKMVLERTRQLAAHETGHTLDWNTILRRAALLMRRAKRCQ